MCLASHHSAAYWHFFIYRFQGKRFGESGFIEWGPTQVKREGLEWREQGKACDRSHARLREWAI